MTRIDSIANNRSLVSIDNFKRGSMLKASSVLTTKAVPFQPLPWRIAPTGARGPRKGGKAKILTQDELRRVLRFVELEREYPEADIIKILLSFFAGLRAG